MSGGEIAKKMEGIFDMITYTIKHFFKLRFQIYLETVAYGHMGRESVVIEKTFKSPSGPGHVEGRFIRVIYLREVGFPGEGEKGVRNQRPKFNP